MKNFTKKLISVTLAMCITIAMLPEFVEPANASPPPDPVGNVAQRIQQQLNLLSYPG